MPRQPPVPFLPHHLRLLLWILRLLLTAYAEADLRQLLQWLEVARPADGEVLGWLLEQLIQALYH